MSAVPNNRARLTLQRGSQSRQHEPVVGVRQEGDF